MNVKKNAAVLWMLIATTFCAKTTFAQQCTGDDQPYLGRCIGKYMSDYIACVDSIGGNRSEIDSMIKNNRGTDVGGGASASASTKGKLIGGSAGLNLSKKDELSIINKINQKYFPGGASVCSQFEQKIRSDARQKSSPHDTSHNVKLPIRQTMSGGKINFFEGFSVESIGWSSVEDGPVKADFDTPENGHVWLESDEDPIDVSFKNRHYHLSIVKGNGKSAPLLVLSR